MSLALQRRRSTWLGVSCPTDLRSALLLLRYSVLIAFRLPPAAAHHIHSAPLLSNTLDARSFQGFFGAAPLRRRRLFTGQALPSPRAAFAWRSLLTVVIFYISPLLL